MNDHHVTKPRHLWVLIFRQRGREFARDGAYVVRSDRGDVTVNTSHPDYPPKPAPLPNPRPHSTGRGNLSREQRGRRRWRRFHLRLARPISPNQRAWLWRWTTRLARGLGGCSCEPDWQTILKANPIDWSDPEAWGVKVHNLVNAKLKAGKRSDWTVEQARQHARLQRAAAAAG